MRVNVSHFFTDLEHDIQEALFTYWNDNLTQGQLNTQEQPQTREMKLTQEQIHTAITNMGKLV